MKKISTPILILMGLLLAYIQFNNKKNDVDEVLPEVTSLPIQKPEIISSTISKTVKRIAASEGINEQEVNSNTIAECENPFTLDDLMSAKYFDEAAVELAWNTDILLPALANSMEMESQIANALITPSDDSKTLINKLSELQAIFPDNTLLSYDLLSSCTNSNNECDESIFKNSVTLEPHNGAVWLLSAINEINGNNIDAAVNALLEASSASYYEDYWGEHFALFQEAFNQTGAENSLATQIATMGYIAAATIPFYSPLVNFCKNIDSDRADVLDACLNIGQRLSNGEGTSITHMIGLSIRKAIYERYNNAVQLEVIENERAEFLKTGSQSSIAVALIWQSRQRTSDWIQQLKNTGEVATTKYVVEQAIRLSSDPNFDPCAVEW